MEKYTDTLRAMIDGGMSEVAVRQKIAADHPGMVMWCGWLLEAGRYDIIVSVFGEFGEGQGCNIHEAYLTVSDDLIPHLEVGRKVGEYWVPICAPTGGMVIEKIKRATC